VTGHQVAIALSDDLLAAVPDSHQLEAACRFARRVTHPGAEEQVVRRVLIVERLANDTRPRGAHRDAELVVVPERPAGCRQPDSLRLALVVEGVHAHLGVALGLGSPLARDDLPWALLVLAPHEVIVEPHRLHGLQDDVGQSRAGRRCPPLPLGARVDRRQSRPHRQADAVRARFHQEARCPALERDLCGIGRPSVSNERHGGSCGLKIHPHEI